MPYLDRDSFVALLNKLGSGDDEEVLTAARTIHQRVQEADITWDELLLPAPSDEDEDDVDDDMIDDDYDDDEDYPDADGQFDEDEDEDARPAPNRKAGTGDTNEDRSMIDRILKSYDISPQTREDLEELKQDIEDGEFTDDDRRYLQALENRLRSR